MPFVGISALAALSTVSDTSLQGLFAINAKWRPLAVKGARKPTVQLPVKKTYIIEREEKGSDVNLASYLLLDAFHDEYDLAVVVSNDSDLAEPIRLVRREFGVQVCIVNPRKNLARGLKGIADDYRNIRFEMVEQSQFPLIMTDGVGTFHKPPHWH